jgi:hypothetical protein
VTVAGAYVVEATEPIPDGCTEAIVTVMGRVLATNSGAGTDQLYTSAAIDDSYPSQFPTGVGAGAANTSAALYTKRLTGLTPGGVITVGIFASTGNANWAANGANAAQLSAIYLFLR